MVTHPPELSLPVLFQMLCSSQAAQFKVLGCQESNQGRTRGSFGQRGVHEGGEAQGKLPRSWSSRGICVSPHRYSWSMEGVLPCIQNAGELVHGYTVSQTRSRTGYTLGLPSLRGPYL